MKVARADWAANIHWDNVSGKPAFLSGDSSVVEARISQLESRIAALEGSSGGSGSSGSDLSLEKTEVEWVLDTLLPLQFASESFTVAGIAPGDVVFATTTANTENCLISCVVPFEGLVTIVVYNTSIEPAVINAGSWIINKLNNG